MAKKAKKESKSFEETLWATTNKLRGPDELVHDGRWNGYETPPTGNANYIWVLHMVSKLSENGVAGFALANGSMSTNTKGEGEIRQKLIENDLVDCKQLFEKSRPKAFTSDPEISYLETQFRLERQGLLLAS